jgi:hypothetical protein
VGMAGQLSVIEFRAAGLTEYWPNGVRKLTEAEKAKLAVVEQAWLSKRAVGLKAEVVEIANK